MKGQDADCSGQWCLAVLQAAPRSACMQGVQQSAVAPLLASAVTTCVGRPLSPSLLQVTKPVYASTTKRNLDGLSSNTQREEAPALSFPDICFAVEDSEAVFDTLVSRLCCMSSACLQGSA